MLGIIIYIFFNDTATTEIYTLSLHDALPICVLKAGLVFQVVADGVVVQARRVLQPVHEVVAAEAELLHQLDPLAEGRRRVVRSEEHTSELQSRQYLVCRLLLEKKKTQVSTLT